MKSALQTAKSDYRVPLQRLSDEERLALEIRLSHRHRSWGHRVPMVDVDFLVCEYDFGRPVAIIEYKHENAGINSSGHPSYKALRALADSSRIPFYAVRWADDFSWFRVIPINQIARTLSGDTLEMTEEEYIEFLHKMRKA